MKRTEKLQAIELRKTGHSLNEIAQSLGVAKSSVSIWVRDVVITADQYQSLGAKAFSRESIEKRRLSRLQNEKLKRDTIIGDAQAEIVQLSLKELWLMGVMLYWAEGGKTQRMVRFSNGDPEVIKIMMRFPDDLPGPREKVSRIHTHSSSPECRTSRDLLV